jgi:hypothetical protein
MTILITVVPRPLASSAPQRAPRRQCAYLTNLHRALFVWLYRLFPSILQAITIVKTRDRDPLTPVRISDLLALEVSASRRTPADRHRGP